MIRKDNTYVSKPVSRDQRVIDVLRDMRHGEMDVKLRIHIEASVRRSVSCMVLICAACQLSRSEVGPLVHAARTDAVQLPGLSHQAADLLQSELELLGITVTRDAV